LLNLINTPLTKSEGSKGHTAAAAKREEAPVQPRRKPYLGIFNVLCSTFSLQVHGV